MTRTPELINLNVCKKGPEEASLYTVSICIMNTSGLSLIYSLGNLDL